MNPKRGYYSLIQFCPDPSRLETVNVGVVLFCPEEGFLDAITSSDNRRAEKLVGRGNLEKAALNAAKFSLERRLEVDRDSFQSLEDLRKFIDSRGNWLTLTDSRPIKVFDAKAELENLFNELVGGVSLRMKRAQTKQLFPALNETFEKLHNEGRAQLNIKVRIPIMDRLINVPYAYQNGALNLVKPHHFSHNESSSVDAAMRLAVEGDLLQRHGSDIASNAQLVVVASFDETNSTALRGRISDLFNEYSVKNIIDEEIDEFLARVNQEAH